MGIRKAAYLSQVNSQITDNSKEFFLKLSIHFLFSEGARQQLENLRTNTRHRAALTIQSTWRGWRLRRRWPTLKRNLELQGGGTTILTTLPTSQSGGALSGVIANSAPSRTTATAITGSATSAAASGSRPRPQPIAGTPPPDPNEKCDQKMIQQTCTLFGLDLVS